VPHQHTASSQSGGLPHCQNAPLEELRPLQKRREQCFETAIRFNPGVQCYCSSGKLYHGLSRSVTWKLKAVRRISQCLQASNRVASATWIRNGSSQRRVWSLRSSMRIYSLAARRWAERATPTLSRLQQLSVVQGPSPVPGIS